jgi:hypothetical protein
MLTSTLMTLTPLTIFASFSTSVRMYDSGAPSTRSGARVVAVIAVLGML